MTDREIMQQALDALEFPHDSEWSNKAKAIEALQHALAQPEQDWSLLKATQAALREHQARIKELESQIVQPDVPLIGEGKTEQEPVAWMQASLKLYVNDRPTSIYKIPLYTAPPRKPWVGLTDDERSKMIGRIQHDQYTRQRDLIGKTQIITEMYLKEKNGG